MSVPSIVALVAEARALARQHPCDSIGHAWVSEGGRRCPRGADNASQAVYRCTRCGDYDYGEPGGPGAADCARPCTMMCADAEPAR